MYPKVKVRQEPQREDGGYIQDLGLKGFVSLVTEQRDVFMPSIPKVPKCYVPHVHIPRVPVTEDFGDSSLTSDSPGSSGPDKDENIDENQNRVNIRASSIPRPRAVISSPDNDIMIGDRNRDRDGRVFAPKNGTVLQNRHAQCKVKSHDVTDVPQDTRKSKEAGSNDKIDPDPVGKKKVLKGSKKSENVPRNWKF